MDGSIIAIIYGVILVLFFVLLVTLTITLIVSKSKGKKEYKEEAYVDEEYDEYDLFAKEDKPKKEWYEEDESMDIDSILDSAFADSSATDTNSNQVNYEIPTLDAVMTENASVQKEKTPVEEETPQPSPEPIVADVAATVPNEEEKQPEMVVQKQDTTEDVTANEYTDSAFSDSAFADSAFSDSAFASDNSAAPATNDMLDKSVKEAEALSATIMSGATKIPSTPKKRIKSNVSSSDDFYWYNKMDVAEKPSYKTEEMYYHYFNIAKDCIEDLIIEMYDCALVRTEEIKYIAYGIEPRAVSMKEILTSGNRNYMAQTKLKTPTMEDRVKIYEKWCGYVDRLFEKVHIHADSYTMEEIRELLCEFGKSDVDVLIEGM